MIFFLHTPEGHVMVGGDYVPRIGEKLGLRGGTKYEHATVKDGVYVVEDVIYDAPGNPGRQRVDVYGRKMGNHITRDYETHMAARYQDELKRITR